MARTSTAAASQISKLQKQLAALQKKEAERRKAKHSKALAAIVKIAKDSGLGADDIVGAMKSGKAAAKKKTSARKSSTAGKTIAPKYRNPADPSQTWTGRGKSPAWIVAMKEAGTLESALISTTGSLTKLVNGVSIAHVVIIDRMYC